MSDAKKTDWVDEGTSDGSYEGEWVTAEPGLVVTGTLEKAFLVEDDEAKFNPAYAVRGEKLILIGERASYRDAIRNQKMGSTIKISFIEKTDIKTKDGKKTGKTQWLVSFQSKRDGKGEIAAVVLKQEYNRRTSEQLPF